MKRKALGNKTKIVIPDHGTAMTNVNDMQVQNFISPAMLLDIFDEPIVFNRAFVGITNSAIASLFLSYAIYTSEKLDSEAEGWFSKTAEEWQRETGMTKFEQQAARKILKEKQILIERKYGMPALLYYKVRMSTLMDLLSEQAEQRWGETPGF